MPVLKEEMKQYLLDTSILIAHLRGVTEYQLENNLVDQSVLSYVTVGELLQGVKNRLELKITCQIYSHFEIDWGTPAIHQLSHQLLIKYALSHGVGVVDALIAATALERDLVVLTLNTKHFGCIKELKVRSKI